MRDSLRELFDLKRRLLPRLGDIPFVEEDKAVVCAWYPAVRAVLLWNLAEQRETVTLKFRESRRPVTMDSPDVELVSGVG
ncbi:MAG: hypothetical protein KA354_05675 [Phycisphaerae bacterium]|nr:hypothetical protein [Phycisphaerae bacterium]